MTARRLYQSERDLAAESEVAETLQRALRCTLHRFPSLHAIDWFAERDGVLTALVELKTRTHVATHYPTLLLAAHKWLAMRDAAAGLHVPAMLVVRFGDGAIRYGDLNEISVETARVAGRYDRADVTDVELCVFIPVAELRELARAER